MADLDCVALLQWALPRRQLRWNGYRNVRGQVCKRLRRRAAELGLGDLTAYRERLESDPDEWALFDRLSVVTISRFYRDRRVWDALLAHALPAAALAATAAGETELRCYSIGCASGEEPYTLSLAWHLGVAARHSALRLHVVGIDVDDVVLSRAREARYGPGTLKELPRAWIEQGFDAEAGQFLLRERFRASVELRRMDVRTALPDESCRVLSCRNSVFTYFDSESQRLTLEQLLARLCDGGALVVGRHEQLPPHPLLAPWYPELGIYRKRGSAAGCEAAGAGAAGTA